MKSDAHDAIAKKACGLIKRIHGCTIGALDFSGGWNPERVDGLLFNSRSSFMVEAKVSRSDFLADAKKQSRINPELGVGRYRYYACPEGLILPEELPDKWGLIYVPEKGRLSMPVGYGGWAEVYREKEVMGKVRHAFFGSRGPIGTVEAPCHKYAFEDRCLTLENRYLYALATRYKSQKFMKNMVNCLCETSPEETELAGAG